MHNSSTFSARPRDSFSLVELLTVVAVMSMFVVVAAPAFTRIAQGQALAQAGQQFADSLSLGRDEALTRNHKVTVRLIKATSAGDATMRYRAMQTWVVKDDSGTVAPLSKVTTLPDGIVFSETPTLVPLLQSSIAQTGTMTVSGKQAAYTSFSVTANGALDGTISSTDSFLTLVAVRDVSAASPKNFFTVFINPVTGKISIYRP